MLYLSNCYTHIIWRCCSGIASRQHIEAIDYVIEQALVEADTKKEDVDAIAVTYGPGLVGALLVGLSEAKALAFALNKPLVPVHHMKAILQPTILKILIGNHLLCAL